jgi:hypothetical protein
VKEENHDADRSIDETFLGQGRSDIRNRRSLLTFSLSKMKQNADAILKTY